MSAYVITLASGEQYKTPTELAALECFEARDGLTIHRVQNERPVYAHRQLSTLAWQDWD